MHYTIKAFLQDVQMNGKLKEVRNLHKSTNHGESDPQQDVDHELYLSILDNL